MYDGAAIEYNHGSGVNVDNSAFFRMDGGQITNNTASSYGIVFINGGTFEMNGGAIYNNITQSGSVCIASCTSSSYGFKNGILRLAGESAFIDGDILIQPTAYIILTEPIVSSDKLYTLEVSEWFPSGNPIILPDGENVPDASVYLPHFPRSSNTIKNGYTYLKSYENIAAKIAGSFSGRILYTDGTPAGGCTVEFIDADGRCVKTQLAGPDGSYASGDLFTGGYTVKAADQAGNVGSTAIEIKQIYSWESNTVLLGNGNITLKACSSVHGKVSDEQGNYIPNALVSLLTESGTVIFSTNSNEEGFYTISGIENGNYLLRAESSEGNTGVEELFAYHSAESLTCNITVKTSACISGVTIGQDGSPVVGASVLLRDKNDLVIAKTTSLASGGFFFDRVPAGSYALSAEAAVSYIDSFGHLKERYVSGVGQASVAPPYEDVSVGNILLKPEQAGTATISGKVTAHGEKQISIVIARDAYGNELCA